MLSLGCHQRVAGVVTTSVMASRSCCMPSFVCFCLKSLARHVLLLVEAPHQELTAQDSVAVGEASSSGRDLERYVREVQVSGRKPGNVLELWQVESKHTAHDDPERVD